jgi:hypothetical protein
LFPPARLEDVEPSPSAPTALLGPLEEGLEEEGVLPPVPPGLLTRDVEACIAADWLLPLAPAVEEMLGPDESPPDAGVLGGGEEEPPPRPAFDWIIGLVLVPVE